MAGGDYRDDLTISNDAVLWRNIPPRHFVLDENASAVRPSSAAFMDDPDNSPMSVLLGDEVLSSGRTAESIIANLEGFALAEFTASAVRECGQLVVRDPTDEEPAHALVVGDKKKRSIRRRIAENAKWLIPPGRS
ncbi:MAG TPA: hypothetical protein VMV69_12915 [Pirellulales bacterium]|nr:hypothetical protein [Pirellulales bacterium]